MTFIVSTLSLCLSSSAHRDTVLSADLHLLNQLIPADLANQQPRAEESTGIKNNVFENYI